MYLSDCNKIRTNSQLGRKGTIDHLEKLTNFLSCAVSTIRLYDPLFVFLSCHLRVRVNLHSIIAWVSRNSFLKTGATNVIVGSNPVAVN